MTAPDADSRVTSVAVPVALDARIRGLLMVGETVGEFMRTAVLLPTPIPPPERVPVVAPWRRVSFRLPVNCDCDHTGYLPAIVAEVERRVRVRRAGVAGLVVARVVGTDADGRRILDDGGPLMVEGGEVEIVEANRG
jgi:hypothetical protein